MKIKTDFVTNSSSTSFVIMSKGEFFEDDFLELMGVEKDSDFYDMVSNLYDEMMSSMEPAIEYYNHEHIREKYPTFKDYIISEFSEEVYNRYVQATSEREKVYIGSLSSDINSFISFVCTDCFIEENEKIYLNYTNCGW